MPLDFSKIAAKSTTETVTNPRDLFAILPDKDPKYQYLRDVQSEVLVEWFNRRNTRDLRLKMNTGGGKTVVGLLILKSCLNEDCGPAVYVAPTPYLASQVTQEADALGIPWSDDPRDARVTRGKCVLITNIYVLLNGLSKFGVGTQGSKIPIGSLVLDDAHACLETAKEQFTLRISATHSTYAPLLALFRSGLESQSSSTLLDVEAHEPYSRMLVPFWSWQAHIKEVEALIHAEREDEAIKFCWPLLKDYLKQCRCVFGAGEAEISPRCLPVSVIPSFAQAKRRIFMSATFADDSVLVTAFDANPDDISSAITPASSSDIGDRMILVPQELNPRITDEDIRSFLEIASKRHNVVVIVPSNFRAKFWSSVADLTLNAESLASGVERLTREHVGLVVLINKYDGIDLPHDACRVLVLDGLPTAKRSIDQIEEETLLFGTELGTGISVQKIEQGMGRGVRASDDHCAVLLMGRSLTGHLFVRNGISRFTAATRAQFELSEQVGEQVRDSGIEEIGKALDYCLNRDKEWVKAAKSALVDTKYSDSSSDLAMATARRCAFNAAVLGDSQTAVNELQPAVNACTDPLIRGWLKTELAEYIHHTDPSEAQKLLKSAVQDNHQVIRPMEGVSYNRIPESAKGQASESLAFIRKNFEDGNKLMIAVHAIADELDFKPNSHKRFHTAMKQAAMLIGFASHLPESDFGSGPDVLWAFGRLQYLVIECKNEATSDIVSKKDCNQLAGSMNWFGANYDSSCSAIPLLVHPSNHFDKTATPPPGTRVMQADHLRRFRENLVSYCVSLSGIPNFGDTKAVSGLLSSCNLLSEQIIDGCTSATYSRK